MGPITILAMKGDGFLPPRGNYRELKSFRKAEIVYDITYRFCRRFLQRGDRTIDQMVQAARSGKQNIIEGSPSTGSGQADGALRCWRSDVARSAEMVSALALARSEAEGGWDRVPIGRDQPQFVKTRPGETVANIAICLIHQANFLLDKQIARLEQDFLKDGGLRERMTKARLESREERKRSDRKE